MGRQSLYTKNLLLQGLPHRPPLARFLSIRRAPSHLSPSPTKMNRQAALSYPRWHPGQRAMETGPRAWASRTTTLRLKLHQSSVYPRPRQPPVPQFSRAGTPSPPLVLSGPQQQLRKPQCPQPRSTRKLGPKRQSNPREPITAKAPTSSHPPKVIGRQVTQQVLQQDPVRSKHATSALQPLRQNSPWETETLIPAAVLRTTSAHPSHRVIPTAWDTLLFATCHRRTRT